VELGEDFQRAANRLRDLLVRTWPEILKLSSAADEPWLWGLLALSASPDEMRTIRPVRIRQLLREYRIRRLTVEDVLAVVRSPTVRLAPGVREGVRVRINDLIAQLQILHAQRRHAERLLTTTLKAMTARPDDIRREHHDAAILQSLPGVGIRIAATMLAEAAGPLRDRDYHALRTLGGCAPVTKRSGKSHMVCMRTACQRRLRSAFYWWAERSVREEDRSRAHYRRLRQRGHNHARALRGVGDRLLAMLMALLKAGTLYDAARRAVDTTPA
jgi:transposase